MLKCTGTAHDLIWPSIHLLVTGTSSKHQAETMQDKKRCYILGSLVPFPASGMLLVNV